jgi:putative ABC transport system permease protein
MTFGWAWRDLMRHPSRTLLSLVGVAVATALLLDMVMLSGGIERSFGKLLLTRGFQLRVSPRGTLPFDTEATLDSAAALVVQLRAEPGVAEVGAVLGTSVFADVDGVRKALVVYGVTPEAQGIYQLVTGHDVAPGDTDGVLLGAPSAALLHAGVGDPLRVVGRLDPRLVAGAVTRRLVVRGIARFIYDARQQPSVAVTLATAQRLAGATATDRASLLMVRASDGAAPSLDSLVARLRRRFPDVSVNSIGDMVAQFRLRLSYFRQLSRILGTISLIITALLVSTLLAVTVNERIGEIATMRAIGVARATVVRHVLMQGMLLTVVGGGGGVLLGSVTARWLDGILTSFPGLPAAISFFVADPHHLSQAGLLLLGAGVAASVAPSWRAARSPIAATLRSDAP